MIIRPILWLGAVLAIASWPAAAQVYRWVDERGVVNYGSQPPAGIQARKVEPDDSKLSVVPAPPKPTSEGAPASEQAALRERLGRLENQLDSERRLRAAEADQLARARADCEAQRRIDCDTDPYGVNDPLVVVQPVLRPLRHPQHSHPKPTPTPPPRSGGNEAARGARLPMDR